MCGGKFDCMFCLEVLINGIIRFIYLLFQMGWRRFGKLCAIIHLYFQEFIQGAENGCVIIVNVSLVWRVKRVGRKECWWKEVHLCALIIAYCSIVVIHTLWMEGVVSKIFYYFEWYAELISKLLDSTRAGIGLDLNIFSQISRMLFIYFQQCIWMREDKE